MPDQEFFALSFLAPKSEPPANAAVQSKIADEGSGTGLPVGELLNTRESIKKSHPLIAALGEVTVILVIRFANVDVKAKALKALAFVVGSRFKLRV